MGLVILLGIALVACASSLSIGDDQADLIEKVEWVDYSEIADEVGQDRSVRVLSSSTPTRIVIGLWHGSGRPGVRVSSAGSTEHLEITIEVSDRMAGDVLRPWPIAVLTSRAVDPSNVVPRVVETG